MSSEFGRPFDSHDGEYAQIRLDWIRLHSPIARNNTNSIKLSFDESFRTSLTGLNVAEIHN